jgi:hypothetical protein
MPDADERTRRLNRAIERLVAGQPAPVLDDAELDELARFGLFLHQSLPDDLVDPGFRDDLKRDLLTPWPRLVPFPVRPAPRRYPMPALVGVLALAVVATAVVGWMAVEQGGRYRTPSGDLASNDLGAAAVVTMDQARVTPLLATAASPTATPSGIASVSQPGGTNAEPVVTPDPDSPRQANVVDLPPLDDAHVELGALATMVPSGSPVGDEVRFVLEAELPELPHAAPLFRLSTPHVAPGALLKGIAQALGLDPAGVVEQDQAGRTIYTLLAGTSVVFSWDPRSGAFSCRLPGSRNTDASVADITSEALAWLQNLGYPTDRSISEPVVHEQADGMWRVELPLGGVPEPALGHPLGVTLLIDQQGRVVEAAGYWLKLTQAIDVPLMSAEEAWQALLDGRAYWPASLVPGRSGEFRIDGLAVSYILTAGGGGDLVFQPVVGATGTFYDDQGNAVQDSQVFIQAVAGR